ncbi:mRNA decay activator protein ZFP36L1-like [Oppia nitens]|uniref:mRNA decay activator protein ZFP36L1-like n=1 Tax=Oppia nitens TaxID=1686743 RepID=UPI0023DBA9E7|nr:mRNA decay activator protein ZFP36L1-like [Oppia nitens]
MSSPMSSSSSGHSSSLFLSPNRVYSLSELLSSVPKSILSAPTFDPIRYRTEICKNFMELGVCRFNDRCFYAHSDQDLRPITYKHKKYKTQLCRPFHTKGLCDFGPRCAYIHTKPDINAIINQLNRFAESTRSLPPIATSTAEMRQFGAETSLGSDITNDGFNFN